MLRDVWQVVNRYLGQANSRHNRQRFVSGAIVQNQAFQCLFDDSPSNLRFWAAIIFGMGFLARLGWILITLHRANYGGAETFNIALSLANNGTYADAYGQGVGPTAHTAPVVPIILALIIRGAGTGLAGYLIRSILAAIVTSTAFALCPLLAVKCQLGMPVGVTAGIIGAITPINSWARSGDWDAPYTMLGLVGLCVLLGGYWIRECFPIRGGISLGALSGFLCLINPTILQVLVGWWIVGALRLEKNRQAFSKFMATLAVIVVVVISPWAFRNFRTLGGAVWTRSDFGLELQISNNDDAIAELEKNVSSSSLPDPYMQLKEREKVRRMGELPYQRAKKKEALSWIRSHPEKFIRLTMLRIFFFWFPVMIHWPQSIAEALMTVFAVCGLLSLFKKRHPSSWLFSAVLVFYPAVYSVVEVSPRYRLPIEPILLLLGCFFCLNFVDEWELANKERLQSTVSI